MIAEEAPLGKITTRGLLGGLTIKESHPGHQTPLADQPAHELEPVSDVIGSQGQLVALGESKSTVDPGQIGQRLGEEETSDLFLMVQCERRTPWPRPADAQDALVLRLQMLQGLTQLDDQESQVQLAARELVRQHQVLHAACPGAQRVGCRNGQPLLIGVQNPPPLSHVRMREQRPEERVNPVPSFLHRTGLGTDLDDAHSRFPLLRTRYRHLGPGLLAPHLPAPKLASANRVTRTSSLDALEMPVRIRISICSIITEISCHCIGLLLKTAVRWDRSCRGLTCLIAFPSWPGCSMENGLPDLPAPMDKKAGCGLCWVMLFVLGRPGEARQLRTSNPEQGESCREVA